MRTKFLAASLATLFTHALATAAPAPTPTPMAPTGPWNVEFADSMCLLSRPYGPKQEIRLILKPSMVGDKLEIIVTTAKTRISEGRSGKATLAVAGEVAADEMYFNAYSTAKARLLRIGSKEETLTFSALRDTLAIDAERESRHLFALPGIERARPVLNHCLDQLRTIYKVSKADLASIKTEPQTSLPKLFSTSDYPAEALSLNQSGTVGVLLWVEANGHVSTCEVIEPINSLSLKQATCNILQRRARFTPAMNMAGKPVRAPVFTRVRWALPFY